MRSRGIHLRAISREIPKEKKEGWPKEPEMGQLCRNDHAMIRWISGIRDRDEAPLASLLLKLGIEDITSVLYCQWLRWYGHVQWATSCIKHITNFQLPGTRKKGRPRKTWSECVKTDIGKCALASISPLNRDFWRTGAWHSLVLPTPLNGTRAAP